MGKLGRKEHNPLRNLSETCARDGDLVLLIERGNQIEYACIGELKSLKSDRAKIKGGDDSKLAEFYWIATLRNVEKKEAGIPLPDVKFCEDRDSRMVYDLDQYDAFVGKDEILETGLCSRKWLLPYEAFVRKAIDEER